MRNLFQFILRYHFFFLFLALQSGALLLLMSQQQYHRTVLVSSANAVAGSYFRLVSQIYGFANLNRVNEQLALENTRLLAATQNSFLITDDAVFSIHDTVYKRKYSFINAEVISNTIHRGNNYLTLNKGRLHGIEPQMGVITFNGIVGIVKAVSDNFSSVISLLHQETNVSARIVKNDHIGTLTWRGGNYRVATLRYIPSHVELVVGDTIVSSGYSVIFPPGILLGTVRDYSIKAGESFITADIDLSIDFNSLRYVSVVKNLLSSELEELHQANGQQTAQ